MLFSFYVSTNDYTAPGNVFINKDPNAIQTNDSEIDLLPIIFFHFATSYKLTI